MAFFKNHEHPLKLSFIQVNRPEGKVEGLLELENTGIPHTVPTGDYGYREVVVTVELLDDAGRVVALKQESLFVECKTALPYQGKKNILFSFAGITNVSVIKATMVRTSFNNDKNTLLAEATHHL